MNVYDKIRDYLGEEKLPKGAKKINSKLSYVVGPAKGVGHGGEKTVSVWELSAKGVWTEWWVMDSLTFKKEFGIKV